MVVSPAPAPMIVSSSVISRSPVDAASSDAGASKPIAAFLKHDRIRSREDIGLHNRRAEASVPGCVLGNAIAWLDIFGVVERVDIEQSNLHLELAKRHRRGSALVLGPSRTSTIASNVSYFSRPQENLVCPVVVVIPVSARRCDFIGGRRA